MLLPRDIQKFISHLPGHPPPSALCINVQGFTHLRDKSVPHLYTAGLAARRRRRWWSGEQCPCFMEDKKTSQHHGGQAFLLNPGVPLDGVKHPRPPACQWRSEVCLEKLEQATSSISVVLFAFIMSLTLWLLF